MNHEKKRAIKLRKRKCSNLCYYARKRKIISMKPWINKQEKRIKKMRGFGVTIG